MKITAKRLRELFHYDPETGIWTWVACSKSRLNGRRADHQRDSKRLYRIVTIDKQKYYSHRLAWLYMNGKWPEDDLDHRDLDKGNNRWSNIRIANDSLNNANKSPMKRAVPKGVDPLKYGRFQARIKVNLRSIHLGTYNSAEEAADAYERAASYHFGQFARTQ